jgi:hypothetical protein
MKPVELFDLCMDAIGRWNSGEQIAEVPTVLLTLPTSRIPSGNGIRLAGRSGPLGRIMTIREAGDEYTVVAAFNAAKIVQWLKRVTP